MGNMPLVLPVAFIAAAAISAVLCRLLRPLLVRYALARPNARSSHRQPTPQGGGIAVLLGVFAAMALVVVFAPAGPVAVRAMIVVAVASLVLAATGAWDDIRPLPASIRLLVQGAAVGAVVFGAAPDTRLLPDLLPLAAERGLVVLAGVWFVNLTNFMDGLDWLTVSSIVPAAAALAVLAHLGVLDLATGAIACGLAGGLAGFAPFNRPVARLFLGDVGALPLGLLQAYLLYRLAESGALAAAVLLPLYAVCDATFTLVRRLLRGERVWEAHRSHFYQQATDNGFTALSVAGHIFILNLLLCALALTAVCHSAILARIACLVAGILLTLALLRHFSTRQEKGKPH